METITPLTEYTKNQYRFTLIQRKANCAIFAGTKPGVRAVNYEVVRLLITPSGSRVVHDPKTNTDTPIHWDAHERLPGDREWGKHGFTCTTLEASIDKLNTLTQSTPTHEPTRPAIL